jgi:hypothetical protein
MARIVLISCVSKKLPTKAKAKEIYISPLFKLGLRYARSLNPDNIFILSAKYGLLDLEREIEPYEQTLNKMKDEEVKGWAKNVLSELEKVADIRQDEFIFLAGERYRKYIAPNLAKYSVPMKGLGIGKQL